MVSGLMSKSAFINKQLIITFLLSILVGCGSDSNSADSDSFVDENNVTSSTEIESTGTTISDEICTPVGDIVTISGTVQYERVPMSTLEGEGLDYDNIQKLPVRGIVIQALDADSCVVAETNLSETGSYSLDVGVNTDVKIYFEAKTISTDDASWDFEVRDNTSDNGLYVFSGSLATSGTANSIRDLLATSGWDGNAYNYSRNSAPLAILDTVYDALMFVVDVDSNVTMPEADIFWSINNNTASGETSNGEISSNHYSNNAIYLLGTENQNTAEFDRHTIVHEWGHYFEDNLSRSDSIGGSHSTDSILDMRVALGEGFGNAFSAMVTGDSVYKASGGNGQAYSFEFDIEGEENNNPGWFSEFSVQSILYDIYDSDEDGADDISLGFLPIYEVMTSADYINQTSLTSIFSLVNSINNLNPDSKDKIQLLIEEQEITAIADNYGTGETNDGYVSDYVDNIPVYKTIILDGDAVEVCSSKEHSQYFNGLGIRQLIRLNLDYDGNYKIRMVELSENNVSPYLIIYSNGSYLFDGGSYEASTIYKDIDLVIGEHIIEILDLENLDSDSSVGETVCFNVTVTTNS